MSFHTMMLIDVILRAGGPRTNLPANSGPLVRTDYWHTKEFPYRVTVL